MSIVRLTFAPQCFNEMLSQYSHKYYENVKIVSSWDNILKVSEYLAGLLAMS